MNRLKTRSETLTSIMCLRLQLERQTSGLLPDVNEYSRVWGINAQRLALAKSGAPVMHPRSDERRT